MRLLILISVLLAASNLSLAQATVYQNDRYAFSFQYPSKALRSKSDAIGTKLVSPDGRVTIFVYASVNMNEPDILGYHHTSFWANRCHRQRFTKRTDTELISEGVSERQRCYMRIIRHKFAEADIYYNIIVKYPNSQRQKWEPIGTALSESFSFDPRANVRP